MMSHVRRSLCEPSSAGMGAHQAPNWPILEEVTRVYYGHPADYPRELEYKSGQRYAAVTAR
jgi:hypothetical protein